MSFAEEHVCFVCIQPVVDPYMFTCNDYCCASCFEKFFEHLILKKRQKLCPICKTPFSLNNVINFSEKISSLSNNVIFRKLIFF